MAVGSSTRTSSPPPSGSARAEAQPPWARHTARTIDMPRPAPRRPTRASPPRLNGSNSRGTLAESTSAPVLPTTSHDTLRSRPVSTHTRPEGTLWRMAFSIRLPATRTSRLGLPMTGAGCSDTASDSSSSSDSRRAVDTASCAQSPRSVTQASDSPRCPSASARASHSSDSMRSLTRSQLSRTTSPICRSSAMSSSGLDSATSISVRITVSGVRSSWLALDTNRRCASKEAEIRSSISSKVSASSRTSSCGPSSRIRSSSRLSVDSRLAAAVTSCSGRSPRPATR